MNSKKNKPLGVFDSGLGGLTVVSALRKLLPHEDIVYLGDTARVPYGTKGPDTIIKYALSCAHYLKKHDVKAIVVACNTVSAVAPKQLRTDLALPVLSVIEPGARAALSASQTKRIGVLATAGTVFSNAYPRAIASRCPHAKTLAFSAPLFVPLAEEGWLDGEVPHLVAKRYIEPLARANVDVVVLGCTHYPLLREIIETEAKAQIGDHVKVVDSAHATAEDTYQFLSENHGLNNRNERGKISLYVTDLPRSFHEIAKRFLGEDVGDVVQVDLS